MRWKPVFGRLMIELMWGDLVTWDRQHGTVNMTRLSRKIRVRPIRLVDYLEELKLLGYLDDLSINYKTIKFKFRNPGWSKTRAVTASRW